MTMRRATSRTRRWLGVALLGALSACGGGAGQGPGRLALGVTDAPFPATEGCLAAAWIEIDGARARNEAGWVDVPLEAAPGATLRVDLLVLRAGLAQALAAGSVPTGSYSEIRLHVVGASLDFADGTTSRDFRVPSGASSGLKIKVDPPVLVAAGQTASILLDVDLTASFHTAGLGGAPTCEDLKGLGRQVLFHPVVRATHDPDVAVVAGVVEDAGGVPVGDVEVTAFLAGTEVAAETEPAASTFSSPAGLPYAPEGSYALRLPPGAYDLYVRPQDAEARSLAVAGLAVLAGDLLEGIDLTLP